MSRTIYKWRVGPGPNYTYQWAPEAPANADGIVDTVNEASVEIKQERRTPGHYVIKPIRFDVPANKTRYKDLVVPDFTNGLDILSVSFDTNQADTDDEIACGKVIIGKIGVLAVDAASGATSITVATSVAGLLKATALGGALDEGFLVSIGTDTTTDADINTADTSTGVNPSPEKAEYEIKRIGAETPSGPNYLSTLTLFAGLSQAATAGADINLVAPFIREGIPLTKNGVMSLGGETITSGNIPANKRIRFGFKNTGALQKTVRAMIGMLY